MSMGNSNEILIEASALSRRYGPNVAVDNLTLTLRRGEILGLLGPNGAGKSTTLKMLTGNLAPSSGTVKINGVDLAARPKAAKQFLGYLPELPPVHPECTVDEYLNFAASLHGVAGKSRKEAVARAKQSCGLNEMSQRLIGNLSKGFQQRVGLAQAIVHQPPVIVLDEPTVGLDPIQIREIRGLIKSLAVEHSVILSSHILPEIMAVCTRVMIINQGRMVFNEGIEAMTTGAVPSVHVLLRNPPPQIFVEGATEVRNLGNGRFEILAAPGVDLREQVAQLAAQHGWGLLELKTQVRSLEEIFVSLTSGEASEPRKAA